MLKTSTLIFFFVTLCFSNILYANENYKIITKINDKIISNHDVDKEKRYLSALNPEMLNISEEEILKISKQSLIREIIHFFLNLPLLSTTVDEPSLRTIIFEFSINIFNQ